MELKLKTNTKVSYISAYIKDKFPMYVDAMNGVSFMALINNIQFIPEIKNISLEQLKDGSKDSIIDNYVDQYVKENLSNVYEMVNNLCVYICDLIKKKKKYNDGLIFLNDISGQIGFEYFSQIDIDLIRTGLYDEMFLNRYLEIRNQIRNQFISRVKKVIYSMNENVGFSNDTINSLISKIVNDMLSKYDSNKVYDDNLIREKYLNLSNEIKINVKEHIKKVLYNMDLVIGVDTDKVINDLLYMTTISGQMSAIGLINGKLDNLICGHANKNRKHGYNDNDIVDYIYNYLNNIADEEITENQLMDFSKEVKKILMSDGYGYNVSHILDHQCDAIINQLYEERYHSYFVGRNDWIEDYSKKKKKNKIELPRYNPIKKRIQQTIAKLLLISTLVTLGGYAINKQNKKSNDLELIDMAKSLDSSFSYSIHHSNNLLERLDYESACIGVINYYDVLKEYGQQYINLCFYNAYNSGLSIEEMDNLLKMVKNFTSKDENYAELNIILGNDICYLDFIYNSLVRMGCEDIKDERYLNAVISYKQSYYGNLYGIPSDYHMPKQEKEVIDNLIKLYEEYSRNCQIELGTKIMEREDDVISLSSDSSKRGV